MQDVLPAQAVQATTHPMRTMHTMQALRIVMAGAVTSFRYPYFIQGTQPTFEMPPPATLYGHVCSALGELVDPETFRVAVHFVHNGKFVDYEHTHMYGANRPLPLSPTRRELLFQPRLTLYIDRPDWLDHFRSPRYVVTLGRSQDLMRYAPVECVTLQRVPAVYLENTLLPLNEVGHRYRVGGYSARTMPRLLSPERSPIWSQYALVHSRQLTAIDDHDQAHDQADDGYWADPDSALWRGAPRGVGWLSFGDSS